MKKTNKKIIIFCISFILNVFILVIISHFCEGKNNTPPMDWEQIKGAIWYIILTSFVGSLIITYKLLREK